MAQQMAASIQPDGLNPYPWYRHMRDTNPVSFNPALYSWQVFRYDDVLHVLNTPAIFSSDMSKVTPKTTPLQSSIIFTDPPRHKRIRSLTNYAFSPRQLALFEPRIATIVTSLLDAVVAQGKMDVVNDFAYPIPMIVIAEMLGVPTEDREDFRRWSEVFVTTGNAVMIPDTPELDAYLRRMIEERRKHPKDDLISTLVHAQIDGDHLDSEEVLGSCELLLVAGYETTAHLLTNIFRTFDEFPETQQAIWANADLIPAMIEETLRYRAPIQIQARFAAVDTELQGQQISAGQPVMPVLGSADRDERQFPEPDRFDLYRSPNKHVAFGLGGIHFCLGAPLARMEARVALSLVRERLTNIQRDRSVPLEAISHSTGGVKHLPVTFGAR